MRSALTSSAYPPGSGQVVDVAIRVEPAAIAMRVDDAGPPFDPLARPPVDTTLALEARKPGGLGVHFVRQLMTASRYAPPCLQAVRRS
jgi:anti-sigma regulatory factor (Ser/Thr protein kinase)